jgi:hypothetical protein
LTTAQNLCFLTLHFMPTELRPGKIDQTSSDSIVDVLSNSSLPALRSPVVPKLTTITSSFTENKTKFQESPIQNEDKITFFSFIKNIVFSDILWISVAFACLLATVLFYFQILQPLILQKYSETAHAQVIESTQKFYLQADQVDSLQQKILSNTENLSAESCTEDAKYYQANKDRQDLENLKNNLKIDSRLKELPNFGIFYDKGIKSSYIDFVTAYEDSISSFQPTIANTRHVVEFVDYKDAWIDQCIGIKNSAGDTKELKAVCKDIDIRADNYIKIAPAGIASELAQPLENVRSICADIYLTPYETYPQYNSFKLKWLNQYDTIKSLALVTDSSSISKIKSEFEISATKVNSDLTNSVNNRQEFENIWYLLNFNI